MSTNTTVVAEKGMVKQKSRSEFARKFHRQKPILILLIPGILWYIIFKYTPMLGALAAFTDYGTKAKISFIGFENFIQLFTSPGFWGAFRNTLIISFCNLLFYFPLPIILALLMNELIFVRLKRLVQFIVYIPHFFSWVVVGAIFAMLLSPSEGIVNQIIMSLGGDPIYFMADQNWFRSVLVGSYMWRDVGYGTIIYIATISTIDVQLYDAATVDGAGYWQKMLYVTLPSLKSTIATVLLLTVARVLLIFEQVLVMYVPSVYSVSEVLTTYSFTEGLLNGNIGYATAVSLFTAVVSAILVIGCNKISKKFLGEGII
ncbi:ABC transporter permease [Acetivibrio mesophilus]|uniref:Sugar ABC transporter permease n=1 Tax=Acetivibrio mesophilus TaxID=2487273 RepID=A0A4Q0I635_9FIRM|nr:ABC transporter permease subunit [Acetivibrio mesophilus]ODM25335.1 protein lplB [Clostridium sp. Bc-iso-3]RXE58412.1 sugar ABC transporter permease [Acetivibrio mesophilus]HHV28636.1 sugar ABC transporter permease [Clostridium sp.]